MFFYRNPLKWVQDQKIYHTDSNPDGDRPGYGNPGLAATEDNSVLAIAAYRDENITGATFIFKNVDGVFQQTQKLTASGDTDPANDRFGSNVLFSSNGDVLVIGSYQDDPNTSRSEGSVYIFKDLNGEYQQVQKLTASDHVIEGSAEHFGHAMDMSSDGNILAVRSRYDSGAAVDDGVVRIFESSSAGYQQVQKVTSSISGINYAGFGLRIRFDETAQKLVISQPTSQGNSYIFIYESGSGGYSEMQQISTPFNTSVTLSQKAEVIAVGDSSNEKVYIYESGSSEYSLVQEINTPEAQTSFGTHVELDSAGKKLFVTAWKDEENGGTNAGAVYVYENSGSGFVQVQKLIADDPVSPEGDRFGYELELSGDHLYVAASYDDVSGSTSGAQGSVYAFKYTRDY